MQKFLTPQNVPYECRTIKKKIFPSVARYVVRCKTTPNNKKMETTTTTTTTTIKWHSRCFLFSNNEFFVWSNFFWECLHTDTFTTFHQKKKFCLLFPFFVETHFVACGTHFCLTVVSVTFLLFLRIFECWQPRLLVFCLIKFTSFIACLLFGKTFASLITDIKCWLFFWKQFIWMQKSKVDCCLRIKCLNADRKVWYLFVNKSASYFVPKNVAVIVNQDTTKSFAASFTFWRLICKHFSRMFFNLTSNICQNTTFFTKDKVLMTDMKGKLFYNL